MPISYQSALRVYAKKHGKFTLPKKGSSEYDEVRKIMAETEMTGEHEVKKRTKKEAKVPKTKGRKSVKGDVSESDTEVVGQHTKVKRKRTKEELDKVIKMYSSGSSKNVMGKSTEKVVTVEAPPPMKMDTEIIDDPADELKGKKIVKDVIKKKKEVEKKGVNRTGKSTAENYTDMLINSNTGPSAEISAQLPDQKEKIAKSLARGRKNKKDTFIETETAPDKTIKNMKTDDAIAIEGENVQFSFQALRNRLLC